MGANSDAFGAVPKGLLDSETWLVRRGAADAAYDAGSIDVKPAGAKRVRFRLQRQAIDDATGEASVQILSPLVDGRGRIAVPEGWGGCDVLMVCRNERDETAAAILSDAKAVGFEVREAGKDAKLLRCQQIDRVEVTTFVGAAFRPFKMLSRAAKTKSGAKTKAPARNAGADGDTR